MNDRTPALNWVPSLPATCLHAAEAIGRGRTLGDGPLVEGIARPAKALADAIRAADLPWQRFWQHLLPLSGQTGNARELTEWSLRKTLGEGPKKNLLVTPLARCVAELFAAARRAKPDGEDQIDERSGFLRRQWKEVEASLPGAIADLVDPRILVGSATVILMDAVEGGGAAHLWYNSLRIEVVAQQPQSDLPEVVRLAWLLAQLNLDLPAFCEALRFVDLPWLATVAMLPPTLAAAAQCRLVGDPIACIAQAIGQWNIPAPAGVDLAGTLEIWWQTYQESKPAWAIALGALERMLSDTPSNDSRFPIAAGGGQGDGVCY